MRKKILAICLLLIFSQSIFAAIVSDDDSAFVTKTELEALKKDMANQVKKYENSVSDKIDDAISSYLANIRLSKENTLDLLCKGFNECVWKGKLSYTATKIYNQIAPEYQLGYGSTNTQKYWIQYRFTDSDCRSYWTHYEAEMAGGNYFLVDNISSDNSYKYLKEVRYANPKTHSGSSDKGIISSWTRGWTQNSASTTAIRGRNIVMYLKPDDNISYSATVSKGVLTYTCNLPLKFSSVSKDTTGSDIICVGSTECDYWENSFTHETKEDCKKMMACKITAGSTCKLPIADLTNKINMEINTTDGKCSIGIWNPYVNYSETSVPTETYVSSEKQYLITGMPYAYVNKDVTKDCYADLYSFFLYDNGFEQKKLYTGIPLCTAYADNSIIKFSIKNTSGANNSFAIKDREFYSLDDCSGVSMEVDGVTYSNVSPTVPNGKTITVTFDGKQDKTYWFKSVSSGSWKIEGDIIEIDK